MINLLKHPLNLILEEGEKILVKVGISAVSVESAKNNLVKMKFLIGILAKLGVKLKLHGIKSVIKN